MPNVIQCAVGKTSHPSDPPLPSINQASTSKTHSLTQSHSRFQRSALINISASIQSDPGHTTTTKLHARRSSSSSYVCVPSFRLWKAFSICCCCFGIIGVRCAASLAGIADWDDDATSTWRCAVSQDGYSTAEASVRLSEWVSEDGANGDWLIDARYGMYTQRREWVVKEI